MHVDSVETVMWCVLFCIKVHKWKGLYSRILSISSEGITTYNPDKGTVTNTWPWSSIEDVYAEEGGNMKFSIITNMGKCVSDERMTSRSKQKCTFQSVNIHELLCEARSHLLRETVPYSFAADKICRDGSYRHITFQIREGYLQMNYGSGLLCIRSILF